MDIDIEFDEGKSNWNVEVRGIAFELAEEFEFDTACYEVDNRKDYGEERIRALGFIRGKIYSLVFTLRNEKVRVISLRKANSRERKKYAKENKS